MRLAAAAFAVVAALAFPGAALAHATLIRTSPASGAVLAHAPRQVSVVFDDTVRVAGGNAAVENTTQTSVLGGRATAHGRILTIPLEPDLRRGAYSVRWSIVSDDGHHEEGVLAFAVGAGSSSPRPVLGASVALTWSDVLLRTLFYLGILAAGGGVVFGLSLRRLLGRALERPLAQLLFLALLGTFVGGSGIAHGATPGTRFDLVLKAALVVSLVGGAAAALAPSVPRLLYPAEACALALLAAPTVSGHALDPGQPRVLAVLADLAHLASASVWFGGLVALVYVLPRATDTEADRRHATERFSTIALASVAVLAASGGARALTELDAVSQVWSTSYGRALIVKTAGFVAVLGVGWWNRTRLLGAFARLRRSAAVEVVAIAGIVVAVAILTELRPGVTAAGVAGSPTSALGLPPTLPPRDAVVAAGELGSVAVAVARERRRTTVTLVGPDGTGLDGRKVEIGGVSATSCGAGCYRARSGDGPAVRVSVDGRTLTFALRPSAPDAAALLERVTRAYRSSRTIVFDETLASTPRNATTTRFTVVAPNRLSYATEGGPSAVVIGTRRWDRASRSAPWVASGQTPLQVTQPYWTSPTNVHLVAPDTLTFLDRAIPAWFRVTLRDGRPSLQHMTAASHFMTDRYVGFDVPATVSPPSR